MKLAQGHVAEVRVTAGTVTPLQRIVIRSSCSFEPILNQGSVRSIGYEETLSNYLSSWF